MLFERPRRLPVHRNTRVMRATTGPLLASQSMSAHRLLVCCTLTACPVNSARPVVVELFSFISSPSQSAGLLRGILDHASMRALGLPPFAESVTLVSCAGHNGLPTGACTHS